MRTPYTVVLLILLVLFLIFLLLTTKHPVFGVAQLVVLLVLSGLGVTKLLRNQLGYQDILSYMTNSLVFGSICVPFVLFILGLFGFHYTTGNIFIFFTILIALNILYVFFTKNEEDRLPYIKWENKKNWIDIFGLVLILIFFFLLVQICLEQYTPMWDSFTFWGVDAKYIFENRVLRTVEFDLLSSVSYSSYYPLLLFLSYLFMGGIFEQFSSLITVLFSFLAFLIIFNQVRNSSTVKNKTLVYTSSIFALASFLFAQNIVLTQYADVFSSFLVLLFVIILLKGEIDVTSYYKRLLILLFICLVFYLIKYTYFTIALQLFIIWLFYDLTNLKKRVIEIMRDFKFWLVVAVFVCCIVLSNNYLTLFKEVGNYGSLVNIAPHTLQDYLLYVFDLFKYLLNNLPLGSALFGLLITVFLFSFPRGKKVLFAFFSIVFVTLLPIGFYILNFSQDFASMSLLRYVSIGFFSIPFFMSIVDTHSNVDNRLRIDYLSVVSMFIICSSLLFVVGHRYSLNLKITPNDGKYCTAIPKYCGIGEQAYKIAGKNGRILLMDSQDELSGRITNMNNPGIFVRYYLAENSVGRAYNTSEKQINELIDRFKPDYLLLLEYDGYFKGCNHTLELGKSYLIELREGQTFLEENKCFIEKNSDIILLDK